MELNRDARRDRGLPQIEQEFRILRREWADRANEKLQEAGVDARLEPRSRAQLSRDAHSEAMRKLQNAQNASRVPSATVSAAPSLVSRFGDSSHSDTPVLERSSATPERALSPEEIRAQSAQNWLAYRAAKERGEVPELDRTLSRARDRSVDAGLDGIE